MAPWRENALPITGPLWRGSTGHRWISCEKCQWQRVSLISVLLAWTSCCTNGWYADDLKRHDEFDVTVGKNEPRCIIDELFKFKFRRYIGWRLGHHCVCKRPSIWICKAISRLKTDCKNDFDLLDFERRFVDQGALLLTRINFNPSMDK